MDRITIEAVVDGIVPSLMEFVGKEMTRAVEPLLARIAELEARKPEKGEKGNQGEAGPPGKDGAPGPQGPQGEPGPIGLAGEPGQKGDVGPAGKDGAPGLDGKDGQSIEGKAGRDGQPGVPGAPGRDGADGKDGADGLGFDHLEAKVLEDGRTVLFSIVCGERSKEFPLKFPIPIDKGVWREGTQYEQGDAVTFGGSLFIAQEPTSDRPESSKAWRLSVKRGQNGRDGIVKSAAEPAPIKLR